MKTIFVLSLLSLAACSKAPASDLCSQFVMKFTSCAGIPADDSRIPGAIKECRAARVAESKRDPQALADDDAKAAARVQLPCDQFLAGD